MATREMEAKLISQANVATVIADNTMFSVNSGSGQPQQNVAYSTLETKMVEKVNSAYLDRVTDLETKCNEHSASISSIKTKDTAQDARLNALENNVSLATYTLEASSNPVFEVLNKNAAKQYISQMGGYLFWNGSTDGKVYAAKLNPTDWGKFADGTPVTEEIEAATETMVHVPDCHYLGNGTTMNFGGLVPVEGGHVFGSPHWVGAYLGHIADGALHSRPNVTPSHSQTMTAFWNYAQALHANKQYGLANYGFFQLVNALSQAESGILNTQGAIGAGFQTDKWEAARDVPTGLLRSLGDGSGKVYYIDDVIGEQYPVKRYGFEDLWGKLWEFRPGIRFEMRDSVRYVIVYDGNQVNNTAEGREFVTSLQSASGTFVTKMKLGEYWDMIPEAVGGSSTSYYCDGAWVATTGELLYVGGHANSGSHCGLSCTYSYYGFSHSSTAIGARLAFWSEPEILGGSELVAKMGL